MSWQDVKARYMRDGGVSQSTEDMAARRVLRALGIKDADIYKAESAYGTDAVRRDDSTMLERARALAAVMAGARVPPVEEFKTAKAVMAHMSELAEGGERALVYRVKNGELRVLVCLGLGPEVDMSNVPTPCSLQKTVDGLYVADCDAGHYFDTILRAKENNYDV